MCIARWKICSAGNYTDADLPVSITMMDSSVTEVSAVSDAQDVVLNGFKHIVSYSDPDWAAVNQHCSEVNGAGISQQGAVTSCSAWSSSFYLGMLLEYFSCKPQCVLMFTCIWVMLLAGEYLNVVSRLETMLFLLWYSVLLGNSEWFLLLFVHLQEATGCSSCECCLSLCFPPWLSCNSWKNDVFAVWKFSFSWHVFAAVLHPASTAWTVSWRSHGNSRMSCSSADVVVLCATIPTIEIQTCHAGLLISFMNSSIDVGDDGRILVSGFCEPDVRLMSMQPQTCPNWCGTFKCSSSTVVAANQGRMCSEDKKSDGDCLWFQHTAGEVLG